MMEGEEMIGRAEQVTVRFVGHVCFIAVAVIALEINCFFRNLDFLINILKSKTCKMGSILLFLITEVTNIQTN
jgi:hypothetical protein